MTHTLPLHSTGPRLDAGDSRPWTVPHMAEDYQYDPSDPAQLRALAEAVIRERGRVAWTAPVYSGEIDRFTLGTLDADRRAVNDLVTRARVEVVIHLPDDAPQPRA